MQVIKKFSVFNTTLPAPGISSSRFHADDKAVHHWRTCAGSIADVKQMIASIDSEKMPQQSCALSWPECMHDFLMV